MPASTRSSKKQASLEDVGAGKASSSKPKPTTSTTGKRKATKAADQSRQPKKQRKEASAAQEVDDNSITINRAPVLELWASCVTHLLYPSLSWSTCLSAGGAIATITAISKGRSIGKIDKPDPGEAEKKKQERKKKAEEQDLDELDAMSFKLSLSKDGHAMVGGKPKKPNEEALRKKYGESYDQVKKTFNQALESWKGKEQDLSRQAFGMYEQFRPNIPPGQSGWGRKGQLNLDTVRSTVSVDQSMAHSNL